MGRFYKVWSDGLLGIWNISALAKTGWIYLFLVGNCSKLQFGGGGGGQGRGVPWQYVSALSGYFNMKTTGLGFFYISESQMMVRVISKTLKNQ
jgi:hypothetical protein